MSVNGKDKGDIYDEFFDDGILINISACKHFEGISNCKITNGLCIDDENCYFKQLQMLKKENEELKELAAKDRIEAYKQGQYGNRQADRCYKYKQALEKIKQAIEVLAETCNVYPLKTNLDKLITTINEVLNDKD